MPFSLYPQSPQTLKAEARALREERAKAGSPISHSQALEEIARAHGYRDWNTAIAASAKPAACPVALGDKVAGKYLKQPFTGRVISVAFLPGETLFKLTLQFDEPVDVITFEGMSSFRHRVQATINARGTSPAKTSDGVPHMQIEKVWH